MVPAALARNSGHSLPRHLPSNSWISASLPLSHQEAGCLTTRCQGKRAPIHSRPPGYLATHCRNHSVRFSHQEAGCLATRCQGKRAPIHSRPPGYLATHCRNHSVRFSHQEAGCLATRCQGKRAPIHSRPPGFLATHCRNHSVRFSAESLIHDATHPVTGRAQPGQLRSTVPRSNWAFKWEPDCSMQPLYLLLPTAALPTRRIPLPCHSLPRLELRATPTSWPSLPLAGSLFPTRWILLPCHSLPRLELRATPASWPSLPLAGSLFPTRWILLPCHSLPRLELRATPAPWPSLPLAGSFLAAHCSAVPFQPANAGSHSQSRGLRVRHPRKEPLPSCPTTRHSDCHLQPG